MPRKIDEAGLFEAVLQLWVSEGYTGTTTKAIATMAGVNEATLFRRYGGKAELVCAALRTKLATVPLRDLSVSDDLQADLVGLVEAYQQTFKQVGALFPLLLVEAGRHAALHPVLAVAWENIGSVVHVITHHQARGVLREEPPLNTVVALLGPLFVMGLAHQAQPILLVQIDAEDHVRAFLSGRAS